MTYKIDQAEVPVTQVWHILGGIRVVVDNVIITKMTNVENDDGYYGNFLFFDVDCIISGIPELMNGNQIICEFNEIFCSFHFKPEGDDILFSIRYQPDQPEAEGYNRLFPGEGKGYPIPKKSLLIAIVGMGKRFLKEVLEINSNLEYSEEVIAYKKSLDEAEKMVDNF